MMCNNALVLESKEGRYSIELPEDKKAEMQEVCKQGIEKYHGYVHVEITKVRKPRSIEQNNLFHAILAQYYISGVHSCANMEELKTEMKYKYGVHISVPKFSDVVFLKSTTEYNTGELSSLTNDMIREMLANGVKTKKFSDILDEIGFSL